MQHVIGRPPAPEKRPFNVIVGGANRGAKESLRAYAEYNESSTGAEVVPVYVDPMPGRAIAMVDTAASSGLAARAVEAKVEDIIASDDIPSDSPVVLNLDRASAITKVLTQLEANPRPLFAYLLLKLPSGRLWAVRCVLEAGDAAARRSAHAFFDRTAAVTERGSSGAILGAGAAPAHLLAEPAFRDWFAEHLKANLAKAAAGVEPVANSIEVTTDGKETRGLHVVVRDAWADPASLADAVAADPAFPIRRGSAFVVAEVTREGIRFHEARRRTDNRVTVQGAATVDRAAVVAREAEEARAAAEARSRADEETRLESASAATAALAALASVATAALTRADRTTATRSNPVWTTD